MTDTSCRLHTCTCRNNNTIPIHTTYVLGFKTVVSVYNFKFLGLPLAIRSFVRSFVCRRLLACPINWWCYLLQILLYYAIISLLCLPTACTGGYLLYSITFVSMLYLYLPCLAQLTLNSQSHSSGFHFHLNFNRRRLERWRNAYHTIHSHTSTHSILILYAW